jgi:hypothetical protein
MAAKHDRSSYGGLKNACQAMVASGGHRCYRQGYVIKEGFRFCIAHAGMYDAGKIVQLDEPTDEPEVKGEKE